MTEKSIFIEFIGDSPQTRILDYLMTEREFDFSKTDMARNAGVGRATLYRLWAKLIEKSIIVPTRKIGKSQLYKLNKDNPKIQILMKIDNMLIMDELKKRTKLEKIKS